ncbi:MAG: hypothetical protein AMJ94_14060 [Deltaproteobacteria bacterium SM23_61]|nr:MAG: hypothetical protein AMJ94_14060 [Deltaproteobacteria bacterium SM23_61]
MITGAAFPNFSSRICISIIIAHPAVGKIKAIAAIAILFISLHPSLCELQFQFKHLFSFRILSLSYP